MTDRLNEWWDFLFIRCNKIYLTIKQKYSKIIQWKEKIHKIIVVLQLISFFFKKNAFKAAAAITVVVFLGI